MVQENAPNDRSSVEEGRRELDARVIGRRCHGRILYPPLDRLPLFLSPLLGEPTHIKPSADDEFAFPQNLSFPPPRLAQEHILAQDDGKNRLLSAVRELSQAFALAVPHEEALRIRDDVAFFQAVRASLAKRAPGEAKTEEELDLAVRQIVSRAVASEGVAELLTELWAAT